MAVSADEGDGRFLRIIVVACFGVEFGQYRSGSNGGGNNSSRELCAFWLASRRPTAAKTGVR